MKIFRTTVNTVRHTPIWTIALFLSLGCVNFSSAQGVTEIITDYNGYWRSGTGSVNAVKPDNHHNLVSFTFNGTRFSTGVNNALLTANGLAFTAGQYNALPLQNFNGTITSNTKIGFGAMVDGVSNGAGSAPSRSLGTYLNDGSQGLNMGTCVANLPSGTMFLAVSNIQAAKIGDGIPDIIVTQIADPSTSYDSYEFTDINGTRIGSSLNIVLNSISPVGQWVADFYEATGSTILQTGFTQTQRDIRLWAADFVNFGINAGNIANIAYFKINLSGTSDIAFVAYNSSTISVQAVLNMPPLLAASRLSRVPASPEIFDLTVYPNPATRRVTLSHPETKSGDRLLVYDINGVKLLEHVPPIKSTRTALPISALVPGIYHVVYTTRKEIFSRKLVVK